MPFRIKLIGNLIKAEIAARYLHGIQIKDLLWRQFKI